MVVDGEALIGEAEAEPEARRLEGVQLRRPGNARPLERFVDQGYPGKPRISRFGVDELIAKLPREEQSVVLGADGVAAGKARDRAVQPVAEEDQVVGFGQHVRELGELFGPVVFVQRQLSYPVVVQTRKALLPVLLEDQRAVGDVPVQPLGHSHGRVRLRVYAHVRERVEAGAAQQRGEPGDEQRPRPRPPRRRAVPDGKQHPGAEQDQDRGDGQKVAEELDLQRSGDEEVRGNPGEEKQVGTGVRPADGHDDDQGQERCARGQEEGPHAGGVEEQRPRGQPAHGQVAEAVPEADAPERGVGQPGPGDDAQRPPEAPGGELAYLVPVGRGVDVLAGIGVVSNPAHHLRLLDEVGVEARPVDEHVWLHHHEDGERGRQSARDSLHGGLDPLA